jgi:hypothetical protein
MNFKKLLIITIIIVLILSIPIFYVYTKKYTIETFLYLDKTELTIPSIKEIPTDISYQIPVPANQLSDIQHRDIDTDILRNVRVLTNFSKTDELDFYQMYTIIKLLKDKEYSFNYDSINVQKSYLLNSEKKLNINSGAIQNVNLELFNRIKLELISAFNKLILDNELYNNYHPYTFFKLINSNLISYNKNNYVFTVKLGREYKYQQFTLYFDIDVTNQDMNYKIKINKCEVLGIPIPNDIKFHENKKTTSNPDLALDSSNLDIDVMPLGDGKMFQSPDTKFIDLVETNDMSPNYFNNDSLASKVEDRIKQLSEDVYFNSHKCFALVNGKSLELASYKWPAFCESYHPEVNQNGIWDAPCQVDSDCPFYQANKNYPNDFGKCDKNTGKCEMPQGVIPLGFTKYAKQEPDCYNCGLDSISNKCCGVQAELIKNKTANYKSPDYIFKGDNSLRRKNANIIELNGLHVNPSL